ncbi:uncharacterized protein K489DRAFT_385787 [Dissoconium aciculare CBS 342.82]|uniref:Magnesium chelatase n=1 Tax=Dissoconium aciculare CBS 342.82 TaxID=1314786 RepID=A0A6J3MH98_9PEZI|nr:uncharacterized protein K489DRAFT_385787 [Dissoconium aciculare CBS 342.82]KAF1827069.1 hypothetical protein K489DRAFT_385787 [Dissoconium aciculare CBS 342.82]
MSDSIQRRIQQLGNLELALLLSFVAEEHCIFTTEPHNTPVLQEELSRSCKATFNVRSAVVHCSSDTTIDDFNDSILIDADVDISSPSRRPRDLGQHRSVLDQRSDQPREPGRLGSIVDPLVQRQIADVIIVTQLDRASEVVQVQALELIRSKRIFTRSSMQVAPKGLLVVAILSEPTVRLTYHLQDMFCMSHFHSEDEKTHQFDNSATRYELPKFGKEEIESLRENMAEIEINAEIAQYLHNIEVFLRNSRFVKRGVTGAATRHLRKLSRALVPLHNLDYIPPSLVALAARKVYAHRLVLATADNEKTLLWGSDPEAVAELLRDVTVEDVIEDVLASVEAPL